MKIQTRNISKDEKSNYLRVLYYAFASQESPEEIEHFLKNLLTESEKIMIGRRLLIAKLILDGKSYDDIVNDLHVGADTVTKVHRWLVDTSSGHIKTIKNLEKKLYTQEKKKTVENKKYPEPFSFEWLKKKYPLHFLLFNLMDFLKKDGK